jgi:hypothetical protein
LDLTRPEFPPNFEKTYQPTAISNWSIEFWFCQI